MGKPLRDLTNQKFGRWTVLHRAEKPLSSSQTGAYWMCVCECGTNRVKRGADLVKSGGSCGCLKSEINSKTMKKMQMDKHGSISDRFHSRYKKTDNGCWTWIAHTDKDGYGILPTNSASIRAHRFSYELYIGVIPEELVVCHKCDNPSCVNPEHLFIGTVKDNCQDMLSKGRDKMVGSKNNKAKLNENDIKNIRNSTESYQSIAIEYNVSISTIKRIRSGKNWSHVL